MDITNPVSGQLNWDVPLNSALTQIDIDATNALSNIANHVANLPADPHGDRAYAASLVSPITTGINSPNGYVKLDSNGHIPANLISGTSAGGMYTKIFDAVGLYGMTTGTSDTSPQLQSALTAAANSGGGIVYVGPGSYSLANYVVIGSNTWLLLAEGAVINRIVGVTNPPYLVSNIQFGLITAVPSTNIVISGGKWDAVGSSNLTSACTPIYILQSNKTLIFNTTVNNVNNNPAIEINGCSPYVRLRDIRITGTGGTIRAAVPAIRLNITQTSTTPANLPSSLYNNSVCSNVVVSNCEVGSHSNGTFNAYGSFIATDTNVTGGFQNSKIIISGNTTSDPATGNMPVSSANWSSWVQDMNLWADTAGTWSNITLQAGFTAGNDTNSNIYAPQYKINADGTVALRGILLTPSIFISPSIFGRLPAAFGNTFSNPAYASVNNVSGVASGNVYIKSDATLNIEGNFGNNFNVVLDGVTLRII